MKLMILIGLLFALTTKEASVGWYVALSLAFVVDTVIATAVYGGSIIRKEKKEVKE